MAKGKVVQSDAKKVALIRGALRLFAWLPLSVGRALGSAMMKFGKLTNSRAYRTTKTNIETCLPELTDKQQQELINKSLQSTGSLFAEVAKTWVKPQSIQWVDNIYGLEQVSASLQNGKGVLFTGAHVGNWEVALYFLGDQFTFNCMYRPPRQLEMDEVISKGRSQNETKMLRGDLKGVMQMIKALKQGEVAALLSDQEPGRKSGIYVPFFGKKALTMNLVQKMQQKSGAELYQIAAIRNQQGRFDIYMEPIKIDVEQDEKSYAEQINLTLEAMIKRFPEQYQWSYKRFKSTEDGSPNIYKK
ncbi:MAG: lysophospholipid acyltransferase family protein [Kangiellaceae bacterium]|nr:lysophospholipid acyltransferase family protein [Kangiellaceae bacterium]